MAHPDDETLWAGGTIIDHPHWNCIVVCLCRQSDEDRAPRFHNVMEILNATGIMGDLDDGPDQNPLDENKVKELILQLLPPEKYDIVITHNPRGEYTKHVRHEEVSKAVIELWYAGKIASKELWTFAYEDGDKAYYPRPIENATLSRTLSEQTWQKKYKIMTETYGFKKNGWEARTTPKAEAFWQFNDPAKAYQWMIENTASKIQDYTQIH